MKAFFRNNILFLLSAFFLLTAVSFWYGFIIHKNVKNDKVYIQDVSRKIEKQLDKARVKSAEIKDHIIKSDRPTFSKLIQNSNYPYFVFRNNSLYFWSDHSFLPKIEFLSSDGEVSFVSQKSGKYLVIKESLLKRGDIFEIFFYIPLVNEYPIENNYLSSHLNEDIFGRSSVTIQSHPTLSGGSIYTSSGKYLFSLSVPSDPSGKNQDAAWVIFVFGLAGIFCLILYLYVTVSGLNKKIGADGTVIGIFITLAAIRGILLWINFPFSLLEFDLFNSKYFASSMVSPSLGDLMINLGFLLVFASYLLKVYPNSRLIRFVLKSTGKRKIISGIVLLLLCFGAVFYLFDLILVLFTHSQWQVDITDSIEFSFLRISSLIIFSLLFALFLIGSYLFSKVYLTIFKDNKKERNSSFVVAFLILVLVTCFLGKLYYPVLFIALLFFGFVLYLRMPKLYLRPRYGSYLYLLFSAFTCALCGAYAVYVLNQKTDIINKQKFASQLLVENDILGEYLLNEASFYIKNDPFIQSRILSPFSSKDVIGQKISRVYLGEYFEKYDIKVHVFNALGNAFNPNPDFSRWPEVLANYKIDQFKTEYPNIYLLYDPGKRGYKKYLSFNKIRKAGSVIGYILIELKQKKIVPHSVYPELFVDKRFIQPWENKNYSYSIFENGQILYSYGQYNYEKDFSVEKFDDKKLFEEEISLAGFQHLGMKGHGGKIVIVSSEGYSFENYFSNFSFFFIVLMFVTLVFVILLSGNIRFRNLDVNFSTKIQIYLNLAFFLPLFIVSITTLSIISSTYKENLNKSFIKKAETVSNSLNLYLEAEISSKQDNGRLENILVEKSRFIESDINLFDNKGRLQFTNQPLMYEAGLVSKVINPQAYSKIHDNKNNVFMLSEKLGKFNYNSVYIAIKSYETGDLMGILSMPFFESKQEIEKQLVEVLTTILNIFVSIFLIFLLLSYLVSKLLTVPLELITQKLKRTSLASANEPLQWNSKDEIGLLVDEYNRMLLKLEESKNALSRSEKESAWREMAQQVAHEIKNPLTPMKLSIQHLQRALKDKRNNLFELSERSLQMLLDQVNTLSEIATSFSIFAKMPIPKNEKFDLSTIMNSITRLHSADQSVEMKVVMDKGSFQVSGDEKLMGNILSNLIINGIQSVPNDRKPTIEASLLKRGKVVLVSIKDNGTGIPEQIREKVFQPNFSTKFSGSGLGLALAKRGVEHAGGRIWFETMEGTGSTFFIELPLND